MSPAPSPTVLIVGASRGLGHAMAAEFLTRGWNVIGTIRGDAHTPLHDLAKDRAGRVEIETLDITVPEEIAALRSRLSGRTIDMVFVNAGTTTHDGQVRIGDVSTDEFMRVMVTNALSPMRVIEALQDLVPAGGLIGAMSSGQGSIANNETGLREVYRGSKAALNMFMRSFAARQGEALAGPGDEAIGTYQQCAQAQPVAGVAGGIIDPFAPAVRERAKRWLPVKVQQQPLAAAQQLACLPAIGQREIGHAAADERMAPRPDRTGAKRPRRARRNRSRRRASRSGRG
jgi:NAD(P)-dependent dehydrogenase (short-subunit alcohol dehydrogenase family)